jgi:hypothetical protein
MTCTEGKWASAKLRSNTSQKRRVSRNKTSIPLKPNKSANRNAETVCPPTIVSAEHQEAIKVSNYHWNLYPMTFLDLHVRLSLPHITTPAPPVIAAVATSHIVLVAVIVPALAASPSNVFRAICGLSEGVVVVRSERM